MTIYPIQGRTEPFARTFQQLSARQCSLGNVGGGSEGDRRLQGYDLGPDGSVQGAQLPPLQTGQHRGAGKRGDKGRDTASKAHDAMCAPGAQQTRVLSQDPAQSSRPSPDRSHTPGPDGSSQGLPREGGLAPGSWHQAVMTV